MWQVECPSSRQTTEAGHVKFTNAGPGFAERNREE
jgi:hypothetical protein